MTKALKSHDCQFARLFAVQNFFVEGGSFRILQFTIVGYHTHTLTHTHSLSTHIAVNIVQFNLFRQ